MSDEQSEGFGIVTRDVAMDPSIGTTAKALYLVLAVHRDAQTGECWPTIATMAGALGKDRRTAQRALEELIAAGVVSRQERFREGRQVSSLYVLRDALPFRWASATLHRRSIRSGKVLGR